MYVRTSTADEMVHAAVTAAQHADKNLLQALDQLPAAIYITNTEGVITHYNRACIAFAGRTPRLGEDKWCVTWKLFTEEGQFLPHDQCPMAIAIRERRAVRGIEAVAERLDGTRVNFRPYPTPILDDEGNFLGAVNLLLDVTGRKEAEALRAQAQRCRRLAQAVSDQRTTTLLNCMADEYEEKALRLDQPT
jgi:PAS domain S-box-containing protein